MNTSQPFRFFSPSTYVRKRYSPLIAAFVEPTVDEFLKHSGFSFVDIFASIGSTLKSPIRIYPYDKVKQQNFNDFINQVTDDLKDIGTAFLAKSYEETYTYNTTVGPFPNLLHQNLSPDSSDAQYPAWYRILLFRIFESLLFSDFEFHDIPIGILYVTSFGEKCKKIDEVRKIVDNFPEWMQEFSKEIPVFCLVVGNNLNNPVDTTKLSEYQKYGFTKIKSINLCSNGKKLNLEELKDYFTWDYNILSNPELGNNFSNEDIKAVKKMANEISLDFVMPEVYKQQKFYESESDKLNKFSKTLQTWLFKKGEPEKVTQYLNIPVKKMTYLQHAGYSMLFGSYQQAQRSYRYFLNSLNRDEQPLIQGRVQISVLLCDMILNDDPNDINQFIDDVKEIIKNRPGTVCLRGALVAPLISFEFCCHVKNWSQAIEFGQITIDLIEDLYADIEDVKNEFLAIMFEKIVGLETRPKHQISYRSMAAFCYRTGKQEGHALRCFLWLLSKLPKNAWNRLWQTIALEKVIILSEQSQINRSLHDIAYLMSVTSMSDDLQNLLLTQFLTIFNDRNADIKSLAIELKPLLFVKKVKMFDPSQPEFYGYSKYDFKKIIDKFNLWFSANVSRSSSISFEDVWNNGDAIEEEMKIVSCGVELIVEVRLINHHAFTVNMTDSCLAVKYEPNNTSNQDFSRSSSNDEKLTLKAKSSTESVSSDFNLSTVEHVDIHGCKAGNSSTKLPLKITPISQGKYTISKLVNKYWGYIDGFVQFKPISFLAFNDYPRIKIEVVDLPKKAVAHQCIPFYLSVDNQGNTTIPQFRVLCDPFIVFEEGDSDFNKHVQIVTIENPLESMQNAVVQFIYHVPESKEGKDTLHFVVDVQGVKCAYQKVEVEIEKKTIVKIDKLSMKNETLSRILLCKFRSENGRFVSIFKKDGSLIKTIYNDTISQGNKPNSNLNLFGNLNINLSNSNNGLNSNNSIESEREEKCDLKSHTVLAYLDKSEEKIDDSWRCRLLKNDELGVLYEIKGSEYLAQANVKIPRFEEEMKYDDDEENEFYHFKLHIYEDKSLCRVFLFNYNGPDLYIEPLPISNEMNNSLVNSCSWVGKKRQIIGKDRDAIFRFSANADGIAKISGFKVSARRDFANSKLLNISQTFKMSKEIAVID